MARTALAPGLPLVGGYQPRKSFFSGTNGVQGKRAPASSDLAAISRFLLSTFSILLFKGVIVPRTNTIGPLGFESVLACLHQDNRLWLQVGLQRDNNGICIWIESSPKGIDLVTEQLYAQYPDAQIQDFRARCQPTYTASLRLRDTPVYPIRRYPQFYSRDTFYDPLANLVQSLDPNTALVFRIKPIPPDWNQNATQVLEEITQSRFFSSSWLRRFYSWASLSNHPVNRVIRFPLRWMLRSMSRLFPQKDNSILTEPHTSGQHDQETIRSAGFDTLSRPMYAVKIRLETRSQDRQHAARQLHKLAASFAIFGRGQFNGFAMSRIRKSTQRAAVCHLSQEELATLVHFPTANVSVPELHWVESRQFEPPQSLSQNQPLIGRFRYRNQDQAFGIAAEDRRRHLYIMGKTGMGKSTLLQNLILSDMQLGHGLALIDPHGDLADSVLQHTPSHRTNDVIWFNPSEQSFPCGI